MSTYCHFTEKLPSDNLHKKHHDEEYGFPVHEDIAIFERLCLEIFQAGLSWNLIMQKRSNFNQAFDHFNFEKIALYDDTKKMQLMENAGIIRSLKKIEAIIYNAQQAIKIIAEYGSLEAFLNHHHPLDLKSWTLLFKKHFKFIGTEVMNEFLMSTGYLKGAHHEQCIAYQKSISSGAKWVSSTE